MTKYRTQPPWEFLLSASRNTLASYELSRLALSANLRKEIGELLDQWLDENSSALLARWLMDQRARTVAEADPSAEKPPLTEEELASASYNVLPDRTAPPYVSKQKRVRTF